MTVRAAILRERPILTIIAVNRDGLGRRVTADSVSPVSNCSSILLFDFKCNLKSPAMFGMYGHVAISNLIIQQLNASGLKNKPECVCSRGI